ncbi:MAG TPA: hypothetical protein H9918_06395 [Candidatus Ligilactobacillus faecavium]|nr:hypothetical protein [Candidatus Ligilactobacillus faecavium]
MNNRWRRIVKHTGTELVVPTCLHHRKMIIDGQDYITACFGLEAPSLLTGEIITYCKSGTINGPTPKFRKGKKHYAINRIYKKD